MRCWWAGSISASRLRVFVYGTLKRGEINHDRYCRGVVGIEPATTLGHLYALPYGFPGLCVDETRIKATGTSDYLADTELQYDAQLISAATLAMHLDTVYGELLTFDDPETSLPEIDALEGYTPGENSFYWRTLYPVETSGKHVLAWLYHIPRPTGEYLPGGRWPIS